MSTAGSKRRSPLPAPWARTAALVLLAAVWIGLAGGGPGGRAASLALNGGSDGGPAPTLVVRTLVLARVDDVPPPPAVFELRRAVLPPGTATPPVVNPGPTVTVVDAGRVTVELSGEAALIRAPLPNAPWPPAPQRITGITTLCFGDQLVASAGVAVTLANGDSVPATILVTRVVPPHALLEPPHWSSTDSGVRWEFLAGGTIKEFPSAPALLLLSRLVYAAHGADPGPTENGGPLLIAVEEGTVGYLAVHGESLVVPAGGITGDAMRHGSETAMEAGAYAVEQWGATSRLRNLSDGRSWVLVATLCRLPDHFGDAARG